MRVCAHRYPDGMACGNVTDSTRCPIHERQYQRERGTPEERRLDADYKRNRATVMAEAQGRCYVADCTTPATTCDHIVPRRDGGGNGIANLRASCPRHNYGWRAR